MTDDRLEVELEGEEEPPVESEAPARLVIDVDDLPTDEELAAPARPAGGDRTYPGLTGPVPTGLEVTARCATHQTDFVLSLTPLPKGRGYLVRPVPKAAPTTGAAASLTVEGPFVAERGHGCPHCGADGFLVCQCGTISCHKGGRFARCPGCRRRLIVQGAPRSLQARGLGKGKA